MDFYTEYTLKTDKGNFLVPIFHYIGNLNDAGAFLNRSNVAYLGHTIDSLDVQFSASMLCGSVYYYDNFPAMGDIQILDASSQPTNIKFYSEVSGSSISTGYKINDVAYGTTGTGLDIRDKVLCCTICIVVDDFDNYMYTSFWITNDIDNMSYNRNTANSFGYFEGASENYISIAKAVNIYTNFSDDIEPIIEPFRTSDDPFNPAGTTEGTGGTGGTGNFDNTGDNIDIPALPTLSAVDTGFITLFNPSAAQLRDLANYMWSNPLFDLNAWKKIFADPMDAILGLSIVPVNVPSGGASVVTVGNIPTGVSMTKAAAQYVEVDCGSLNVNEFWGAYLDYAPYTKCEINLPYCGIHPLDIDDVMGKTVTVKYHVDVLSGACTAFVKCGNAVLYEFVGQCAASIPITGDNWTNVINGVMQIAASVGSMVATGGLAAPVTGANAAANVGKAIAVDANIASTIMSMKPAIEKSGSLGGVGGMLAVQKPYLILSRPKQALPTFQNEYTGYPSYITSNLGTLQGYTEIEHIHLENVPATNAELDEIIALLKGGVIL